MAEPHVPNYWTPRRVVNTLVWYPEIAAALESGFAETAGDDATGPSTWEPGGALEKLACRKADIDLQLARLKPPLRVAVELYYMAGYESYRAVARLLRVSPPTAMHRVEEGVRGITERLCGRKSGGEDAIEIVRDARRSKKGLNTLGGSKTLVLVNALESRSPALRHD